MAHCLSVKLMYAAHCDWSKYHRLSALHYKNNVTAEIALGLWLQNCLYIVIYNTIFVLHHVLLTLAVLLVSSPSPFIWSGNEVVYQARSPGE